MSCPTCDHTMQGIAPKCWWCPRCGTLKNSNDVEAPKLVSRCRAFFDSLKTEEEGFGSLGGKALVKTWHRMGIEESIEKVCIIEGERE